MAVAVQSRKLTPAKFRDIKASVNRARQTHGEDIDRNTIMRFGSGIYADAELLIREVERLTARAPVEVEPEETEDDDEQTGA